MERPLLTGLPRQFRSTIGRPFEFRRRRRPSPPGANGMATFRFGGGAPMKSRMLWLTFVHEQCCRAAPADCRSRRRVRLGTGYFRGTARGRPRSSWPGCTGLRLCAGRDGAGRRCRGSSIRIPDVSNFEQPALPHWDAWRPRPKLCSKCSWCPTGGMPVPGSATGRGRGRARREWSPGRSSPQRAVCERAILSFLRTFADERLAESYEFLVVREMFGQPSALAVAGEGRGQHAARSEISLSGQPVPRPCA